jgi:L-ascorbate metabolism protein UlaG (beta-lactamase superfamily)
VTATRTPSRPARAGERSATEPLEPPERLLDVRWLGHATVLLELPGVRVLTDPFLRERLGPLRRHGPVPVPASLGRIDLVLVSHAHPDHFDRASLRRLAGDPLVIAPRGLGGSIRRAGLRAREVVVGEQVAIAPGWMVSAVPARHWRWPGAPRTPTVGYLITGPSRGGIWFAGDTARFPGLSSLAGRVDLALLPIGTWGPHLGPGHLSPRTAAELAAELGIATVVPIHWGTLYPAHVDRILPGRLRGPADAFARWIERVAPDMDLRLLEPGDSTKVPFRG